jgi:RimJ/RimL family protein N-acetyltransferase
MSEMNVQPVTLEGHQVRLEPLSLGHLTGLCEAGLDEALWRLSMVPMRDRSDMEAYLRAALADQGKGVALPFATVERATGQVIGSSRFGNIDRANQRVEIGWTWVGRQWQRTAANTEAKYLMLRHAFETWHCARVELKTDALNQQSRRAILRIGAKEEGILRSHMVGWTGRRRDTVYFSIVDNEWPAVKARLEAILGAPRGTS